MASCRLARGMRGHRCRTWGRSPQPSSASRSSASRTGVRLSPWAAAISFSAITSPGTASGIRSRPATDGRRRSRPSTGVARSRLPEARGPRPASVPCASPSGGGTMRPKRSGRHPDPWSGDTKRRRPRKRRCSALLCGKTSPLARHAAAQDQQAGQRRGDDSASGRRNRRNGGLQLVGRAGEIWIGAVVMRLREEIGDDELVERGDEGEHRPPMRPGRMIGSVTRHSATGRGAPRTGCRLLQRAVEGLKARAHGRRSHRGCTAPDGRR